MSAHRTERLADTIRDLLARAIREDMRDPGVGFVTLTGVDLSPDLRHARVYVAAHGDDDVRNASIAALGRAAPFFRRFLAREGRLRSVPAIQFVEDSAVERGTRVEEILGEIHRGGSGEEPAADPPPPDTKEPD